MVEIHVCWTDWLEDHYLCYDCAANFGKQWTGSSGNEYDILRKRAIWDGAYKAAPSHKNCERCNAEFSGDVYQKTFNPNPSPESDSHLFEPEELTIPPIDFDKDSDVAIARWLLLQPKHYFDVPAWQVCALIDSIYWVLYALDHPDESWDVEKDQDRLGAFQRETLNFLWDKNPPLRTLSLSHQKRLPSIFEKVKEILNDEPTE